MGKFDGKTLLELGTSISSVDIVKYAKSEGAYVIVTDYLPTEKSEAKQYADETAMISTLDVDALTEFAREKKVDGVFCGVSEPMLLSVMQVSERLNLPCYLNRSIVSTFSNKRGLKNMLRKHGLPVIDEYEIEDVPKLESSKFPLFIKPVDSSGSKGMSVIQSAEEFPAAYEKAISFSKTKDVLVERVMQCDDFTVAYLIQDGKIGVLYTSDRYVNGEQKGMGTIAAALVYPSKYTDLYFETTHEKVCKMIQAVGYRNGFLGFQGFVENGEIMLYDPAARLMGDQGQVLTRHYLGIDFMESLINYSLTGKISEIDQVSACCPKFGSKYGCNLVFSVKPCRIGRVEGVDFARAHRNVINVTQNHVPGDEITLAGTLQQCVFRMHLVTDTKEELSAVVAELQEKIKIYDEFGNNVMLSSVDPELL